MPADPERTTLLRPLAEDLHARRAQLLLGGGEAKIADQHAAEKLTARERVALLIDGGRFVELGIHGRPHFSQRAMDGREAPADGVITGYGKVDGRRRGGAGVVGDHQAGARDSRMNSRMVHATPDQRARTASGCQA